MSLSDRSGALRRVGIAGPVLLGVLVAAVPVAAQTVQGRLVDAQSGTPIAVGEVSLLSGESGKTVVTRGLTTDSGRFVLTAPKAGRYRLSAERIGYRRVVSPPFDLVPSLALDVELEISVEAVPLAPMVVVSSRPALLGSLRLVSSGFFDREEQWGAKGLGMGSSIDKSTIERRQPTRVSDLFKMIPGVQVESAGGHKQTVHMATMTKIGSGPCSPMVYVDGAPIRPDALGSTDIDDLVSPSSVAGIEVYPHMSKPGPFTDMGPEPCGAIVIWTGYAGESGDGKRGGLFAGLLALGIATVFVLLR